jgi:hypothetical protein
VPKTVKRRLRGQYRTLDPVALLAEIRAAQTELGNRVDRRAGKLHGVLRASPSAEANFARTLGLRIESGEPRATHRRPKRPYKKRVRMPSKLDPHLSAIEDWLTQEPHLTAVAVAGRLAERDPEHFGPEQYCIVRRLVRRMRKKAAEHLIIETAGEQTKTATQLPRAVDGSGCGCPDLPTAPLPRQPSAEPQSNDAATAAR